MPHQLLKFPRAPNNENAQVLPTMEQVLEVLFEVVPYMPVESQISFTSMFRDNTPSPPPDEAPSQHARISLLSDSLHNYVQEKTIQHLFESDLAFQVKQHAVAKTSRKFSKSKGIAKRYGKPRKS